MITFSTGGSSAYKITFDDNSHYLQNGEITLAKNTLGYVIDESTLITLIKPTGDAYISFHIEETNFSSVSDFETWFAANAVGGNGGGGTGSGITSGEVQTMIDESISGKADTSAVTVSIEEAVSGKADESYVETALAGKADTSAVTQAISEAVSGKADTSAVTESISQAVSGKQDTLVYYSEDTENDLAKITVGEDGEDYASVSVDSGAVDLIAQRMENDLHEDIQVTVLTSEITITQDSIDYDDELDEYVENNYAHSITLSETGIEIDGDEIVTESALDNALSGKASTTYVDSALSGKADTSAVTASIIEAVSGKVDTADLEDVEQAVAQSINVINQSLSGKLDTSAYTQVTTTTAVTSGSTDVITSGGVYAQLDGMKLKKVTESQWSTISGNTDSNTLYVVIPDPNQA